MRWSAPFEQYSAPARKRVLVAALILSALLLLAMRILDIPLRTPAAPRGIVSFELAKDVDASRQILASWNTQAKTHDTQISLLDLDDKCDIVNYP